MATKIDAGGGHSCALQPDTTIKCWGYNVYGQLGNGTTTDSNTPVAVTGITGATQISAGGGHSCALLADTTIKCWGYNNYGQLGSNSYSFSSGSDIPVTDSNTPVTVTGITGATQISAGGDHSCALLADTTVKCWGYNNFGQLGNGTNIDSTTPVTVTGIAGATQISAGTDRSCALLADTTIKCWGTYGYDHGDLDNATYSFSNTPVAVTGITGATQISAGSRHSCALLADTTVKCWGYNLEGELGFGTNIDSNTPVTVTGITGATQISAGDHHSCALLADTTIKCWGYNLYGQLGNSTTIDSNSPVAVVGA